MPEQLGGETKNLKFEVKEEDVNVETGEFTGHAAVFKNIDFGNDIIEPGAFAKTIKDQKGKVPILWQHNTREPIGISMTMEEDEKGLKVKGQINKEVQRGKEALALINQFAKAKRPFGLSIGFDPLQSEFVEKSKNGIKRLVRILKELKLFEFSPVTFAMNDRAMADMKSGIPAVDLPLSDRHQAWDAKAAMGRIKEVTGSRDKPTEMYKTAFLWHDVKNAGDFNAYKYQIADIVDGKLVVVWGSVQKAYELFCCDTKFSTEERSALQLAFERYHVKARNKFDDVTIVVPEKKDQAAPTALELLSKSMKLAPPGAAGAGKEPVSHHSALEVLSKAMSV